MSTRVLLAALVSLNGELAGVLTRHPELPELVRVGVDWAGYVDPYPHGEVQLTATTTPAGLLGWLHALGATSGQRLDGVPVVTAEGRIGGLPVGLIAPLPRGVEQLGREWTVGQLAALVAVPGPRDPS